MNHLEDVDASMIDGIENKRKRGRPKCFNEQHALQQAMLLFWEFGYEATSISDLTTALGITAPSLYSAFGDKAELFHRCLAHYLEHESCAMAQIFNRAKTAQIALEIYLHESVKSLIQVDKPTGCMLVMATMNCSSQNNAIQKDLLIKRQQIKETILNRLIQGQQQGDLIESADVVAMADFYLTVLQGLSLQARDGLQYPQLMKVVEHALKAWHLFEQGVAT